MMLSTSSASTSTSYSKAWASAVLPRIAGRATRNMWAWVRVLRGRGAVEDGDLARPDSPSRCTLPITALRVIPPSSAAIWLAERPSVHSFLSSSTRSSVQLISNVLGTRRALRQNPIAGLGNDGWPDAYSRYRFTQRPSAARNVVLDNRDATIWPESGARVASRRFHMFQVGMRLRPHLSPQMCESSNPRRHRNARWSVLTAARAAIE